MMSKRKEDTYYLRVRVTYEDVVEVKATSYVEASPSKQNNLFT